jgi:hypothetical protein
VNGRERDVSDDSELIAAVDIDHERAVNRRMRNCDEDGGIGADVIGHRHADSLMGLKISGLPKIVDNRAREKPGKLLREVRKYAEKLNEPSFKNGGSELNSKGRAQVRLWPGTKVSLRPRC